MMAPHDGRRAGWPLQFSAAVLMAGVLAACSGSQGATPPDDPNESSASQSSDPASKPNSESEPTGDGSSETSWDEIVEAAKGEGRVVFYSPAAPNVLEEIEAAFEAEYPEIDAEVLRTLGSELVSRIDQERSTGATGADVFAGTSPAFFQQLHDDGDLVPIQSPNHAALQDTTFAENPGLSLDNDRAVHMAEAYWIMWNTDLVDEPIEDYDDIVARAEEFQGRVGAPEHFAEIVSHYYVTIEEGIDGVDVVEDVTAGTWLEDFAQLAPRFYDSTVPLTQALASGELKAGIFGVAPVWGDLVDSGAPIEAGLSEKAPFSANIRAGIARWAENPNAAQVFFDFLFSQEGQEAAAGFRSLALFSDIPGSSGDATNMNVVREELLDSTYVATYIDHWEQVMGR